MNFTTSEENYIKGIYHLQQETGLVNTNSLAAEMQTRAASVTDMLKKLKAKKILQYERYKGFKLNEAGKKAALGVVRKHRLWEFFLAEKLKFNWDEVHEVAEHMEHVSSKKLIDKLDEFLGFPKFDPHGDPIPDVNGKMEINKQLNLSDWPLNKQATVCRVINQTPELLDLLHHKKISLGTRLEITKKFDYDESVEIKINKQAPITISRQLAKTIFVNHGSAVA